ncbi:hypothetical protein [Nonomuraea sp. NPDC049607]|uniref:hypothetical protein n=1 Tax=Nonomuraea sp. NPDC049607 TaxID=3154732 RepID=UPI00343C2124
MKRMLAAAVTAAALLPAVPAQAAADPGTALKRQFVPGHGVTISETMRTTSDRPSLRETTRVTGSVEFGKSGVVASDLMVRNTGKDAASTDWMRIVSVGGRFYVQSPLLLDRLPMGKTWAFMEFEGEPLVSLAGVDVFKPRVLRSLVAHAKSVKGGLHRGSLTAKEAGAPGSGGSGAFSYLLGLDSAGLPTRLDTDTGAGSGKDWTRTTVETRFTGWGAKITIKAPSEDDVISSEEANEATMAELLTAFEDIPEGSTSSLGLSK